MIYFHFFANKIEFEITQSNILTYSKFPNYINVLPTDNNLHFTLNKKDLIKSLNKSLNFCNKSTFAAIFEFNNEILSLNASDSGKEYTTTLDCVGIDSIKISFNVNKLLDILNLCDDLVLFKFQSSNKPLVINKDNYTLLLMPLMMN